MNNMNASKEDSGDYYQILNVSMFATTAEITSSYLIEARKLAHLATSHPQYIKVKEAYDILSNGVSRRNYDDAIRPDPYQILGVGKDSGLRGIIVSYRKLARTHHPDKGGDLREFDRITEAYRILSDPQKRSDYDRNGFSSEELDRPNVVVKGKLNEIKGRCVMASREIGMGEVVLNRERPFAAVLSSENGAYQSYCHNCFVSLKYRSMKESCNMCGAHYCSKIGCGLHCERHQRECCFNKEWKESDLCRFNVYERPPDKMLFLVHAVFSGGLVFQDTTFPLVPLKATPLQLHLSELCINDGEVDPLIAEQNFDYAVFVADFLCKHGGMEKSRIKSGIKELITLLRYYETNSIQIYDHVISRPIAKGLYLSTSLFNHSCSPNCYVSFEGDCATIRTLRHIKSDEELCISYINVALCRSIRQAQLQKQWCFHCNCDRCESTIQSENECVLHGTFCPDEECRCQLVPSSSSSSLSSSEAQEVSQTKEELYRPNPLNVNSVPVMDQSFLPSAAGYTGERVGFEYREGRYGMGYYQHEDEYGYPIQARGDSLGGIHQCLGCDRKGVDIYLQQSFILTAERHKYFHTHKQCLYDQRLAAFETAEQLEQVLNLELSCLHPFNPSVIDTIRSLNTMYGLLEKHDQCIKLLRILVIHDQLIYGVVSPQTAHTSGLLARAYLDSSLSSTTTAPRLKTSSTLPSSLTLSHAEEAVNFAEKAQIILSVIFGRNHEVTMAAYLTLELSHNRVDYLEKMKNESFSNTKENNINPNNIIVEENKLLLCPGCGNKFELPSSSRLMACPKCSKFCTANNLYIEKVVVENPMNRLYDNILNMVSKMDDHMHQSGEMLPCSFQNMDVLSVMQTLPKCRSMSFPFSFYDDNMKNTVLTLKNNHTKEWCPCAVCSLPRATKQCSGCKTTKYCSLECATRDFSSHKLVCAHFTKKNNAEKKL